MGKFDWYVAPHLVYVVGATHWRLLTECLQLGQATNSSQDWHVIPQSSWTGLS